MDGQQTPTPEPTGDFKPGETIVPGQTAPTPTPSPEPTPPDPEAAQFFKPDAGDTVLPEAAPTPTGLSEQPQAASISWTASEFIAHHKSGSWYVLLAGAAVGASVLIWLLTKDTPSVVIIMLAAIVFGSYGSRKPRELTYGLDQSGLSIGQRHYGYHDFKSFSVIPEGAFASINLYPLKRFAPIITVYYDPVDEDRIVDILAAQLPLEQRDHDVIEQFMRRIRF